MDDSGRDVTWQAIKYAAYSSTLLKDKIIEIYQQYLNDKLRANESIDDESMGAEERIREFLNVGSINEVSLNEYNSIRIILVANRFRKEITSSALWLNERGIDVRCIRVKPYKTNMGLLLSANQIIPTPESSDMMISITSRINEDKKTEHIANNLRDMYYKYWTQLLIALKKSDYNQFDSVKPSRDNWLQKTIAPGCILTFINVSHELRVEISFIGDKTTNKVLFDKVKEQKEEITSNFGKELQWRRMDDNKASRIQFPWKIEGHDEKRWDQYIEWHIKHIKDLEDALTNPIMKAIDDLKHTKSTNQ